MKEDLPEVVDVISEAERREFFFEKRVVNSVIQ